MVFMVVSSCCGVAVVVSVVWMTVGQEEV